MPIPHVTFLAFDDAAGLTRRLSAWIQQLLGDGISSRGAASLVVSGGTTPVALFETLSGAELDWDKVVISLTDERWVDPDCPESNERLVRTHLLKNRAAEARFVGLKMQGMTARAAEGACSGCIQEVPRPFDVLILGMGNDGHTASLFPGALELPAAMEPTQEKLCMAVSPPAAPHDRMTLTLAAILQSRQIAVLIVGDSKRKVYEKAVSGEAVEEMPIRAVLRQKMVPVTIWWAP